MANRSPQWLIGQMVRDRHNGKTGKITDCYWSKVHVTWVYSVDFLGDFYMSEENLSKTFEVINRGA